MLIDQLYERLLFRLTLGVVKLWNVFLLFVIGNFQL